MKKIVVQGGKRLFGEIDVQGSKNSSLPILAACVLVKGVCVVRNCPVLSDTEAAAKILRHLGCQVDREGDALIVDSNTVDRYDIPVSLMQEMRSSIVFLGSILSRTGQVSLSFPGGCDIGLRPIDLHLSALKSLGFGVKEEHGRIFCKKSARGKDTVISLSFPSVGATENIILASVFLKGRTTVLNAAKEPEISDLAEFLNSCGCDVKIMPEGTIIIDGVKEAHGCEHRVLPDRIAALTYMCAVGAAGGSVLLKNTCPKIFLSALPVFEQAGCEIKIENENLLISARGKLQGVRDIRTMPYPGFPTDAQAPVMAMLAAARGTSVIVESIFENRFKHVPELCKMGANIKIEGRVAIVEGVEMLHSAAVCATDLRGGGALIAAALAAQGQTEIFNVSHIDRGYEKITDVIKSIGGMIERRE